MQRLRSENRSQYSTTNYFKLYIVTFVVVVVVVVDINECASIPCENGGDCDDQVNRYSCTCVPGFNGDTCDNSK